MKWGEVVALAAFIISLVHLGFLWFHVFVGPILSDLGCVVCLYGGLVGTIFSSIALSNREFWDRVAWNHKAQK